MSLPSSTSSRRLYSNNYVSRSMTVSGKTAKTNQEIELNLVFNRILGRGTFGCIEQAHVNDLREPVAIKRVFQDPKYKNRELIIFLRLAEHPNLVRLLYYYYTTSTPNVNSGNANRHAFSQAASSNAAVSSSAPGVNDIYLNLVMECFPESLADLIMRYTRNQHRIPLLSIKLYTYQMLRALGYIHSLNICHRDIKSSNLLVNEQNGLVKLCDFGSAKELMPGQANVAYISSRYYRAPELIFGAELYDCSIDIWSAGCVLAELLTRKCLFMGHDSVDQLAEIIKVLGTPKPDEVQSMNPKFSTYSFPNVPSCPLKVYLPMETSADMVDLLSQMLVYRPSYRIKPLKALTHLVFKDLINLSCQSIALNNTPLGLPDSLFRFLDCELAMEPTLLNLQQQLQQLQQQQQQQQQQQPPHSRSSSTSNNADTTSTSSDLPSSSLKA